MVRIASSHFIQADNQLRNAIQFYQPDTPDRIKLSSSKSAAPLILNPIRPSKGCCFSRASGQPHYISQSGNVLIADQTLSCETTITEFREESRNICTCMYFEFT